MPKRSSIRLATLALAGLVVAGCSDSTAPRLLASRLAFGLQPSASYTSVDLIGPVTVTLLTSTGAAATDSSYTVKLSLTGGTAGALLAGISTVKSVAGTATFTGLRVAKAGTDYRLVARVAGLDSAVSQPFAVTAGPAAQLRFEAVPGGPMFASRSPGRVGVSWRRRSPIS